MKFMDKRVISPGTLTGRTTVPSSKSVAHRAIILGGLLCDNILVTDIDFSEDIYATLDALNALGISYEIYENSVKLTKEKLVTNSEIEINARESGSTLRFFIPVAAALNNKTVFTGGGRLPERPLDAYFELFEKQGIKYSHPEGRYLPLTVEGEFISDVFEIRGDTSSQFITGLMLASATKGEHEIKITTELQSKPYAEITADLMRKFGCEVSGEYNVTASKGCSITEYSVEKDWSQAAFFLVGGIISGDVTLTDMNMDSKQGDKDIVDIIKRFGGDITVNGTEITAKKSKIKGIDIDAADIPDLVPIMSVLACFAEGTTRIYNAERLRIKESDRLSAMYEELTKLGADIKMTDDGLIINGGKKLYGASVYGHNDHRIVMSMAIAALGTEGNVEISDCRAVKKSWPDFFSDYQKLRG